MKPPDIADLAKRAGVPPELAAHHGPLLQLLLAALGDRQPEATPTVTLDVSDSGFDLWKSYSAKDAARILGLAKTDSVHEIDEVLLPRQHVGPTERAVRYFGIDLLCYMKKLKPVDWAAVRDAAAKQVGEEGGSRSINRSVTRPIRANGKTRIV